MSPTPSIECCLAGVRRLRPIVTPGRVFATTHREVALRIPAATGIRALRFHGREKPADPEGYPAPVLKAFRVRPGFDPSGLAAYPGGTYLVDTPIEGVPGGTGRALDRRIARRAAAFGRFIPGGGLRPENVRAAVDRSGPWSVDVPGGVEPSHGVKNPFPIEARFEELSRAGPADADSDVD